MELSALDRNFFSKPCMLSILKEFFSVPLPFYRVTTRVFNLGKMDPFV